MTNLRKNNTCMSIRLKVCQATAAKLPFQTRSNGKERYLCVNLKNQTAEIGYDSLHLQTKYPIEAQPFNQKETKQLVEAFLKLGDVYEAYLSVKSLQQ